MARSIDKHYFLILVKALLISINYQSCIQIRRTFGSKTLQKQPYPDIMPWEWTSLNSMRPFRKHHQNTCKEQQRYSCRQSISSLDQVVLRVNEIVICNHTWGNMKVQETGLYFEYTQEIQTLFHLLLWETYQSYIISLFRFLHHMLQILEMKQKLRG